MLLWFRSFNRRRRVAKFERKNGSRYTFRSISVDIPKDVSFDLKNALLREKYETEECTFIERYLSPAMDVIELGGSIGVLSAFTRSRLEPNTRQIVVEANPDIAEICRRNIAPYDTMGTSKVIQAAVSYSEKDSITFFTGENPHVGRIGGTGQGGKQIEVPVTRLEDICAENGIDRFALICDIEGAEVELIEKSALWKTHCALIILETHPGFYADGTHTQNDLVAKILAAGFRQLDAQRGVYAFGRSA